MVFACGGDNLTLPSEGAPARIEIVGGVNQSAPVRTQLPQPLVFRVTDSQGRPIKGATVDFVLLEDRGGATADPTSDTSDEAGKVSTTITLGTQVGDLAGEAQVQLGEGSTPIAVGFSATAVSANASTISIVSGDPQSGPVGSPLPQPLVVAVTDGFGNGIAGVTVDWAAEGGGEVSDASTTTGANGQTSITRTLGPTAGEQHTVATATGLEGSPKVTFTHAATAGNASTVAIVSGNGQEAPAGSQLPAPLVVRVLDQDGNPIVDRPVSWVVGAGGGSADPQTSNTNSEGVASTRWTLGSAPGSNTLNAVVSGVGTASFTATGTGTGSPSNLAVTTQPPTSVTVGATLNPAPVLQIRDAAGHNVAVAGVEITASVSSGKGQLEGTRTVATDANGQAQFNDLRITGGTGSHKLIFAADGYRSATSNKIEVEKASTTTTITADDPDPSDPNQPVTVSFSVTSPAGAPSGNVEVTASGGDERCQASVAQGSCQITLTGSGDRTLTATYQGDGTFGSSSATAPHHVNEPPPPVNQPPVAQPDAYSTGFTQTLEVPAPGVLANDADPEGAPLTAQVETQPSQGVVQLNQDGSFTYFPGLATGSDSFTYSVSDGQSTSTATVTITIQ
jgi:Big-like domain-containing protein